MYIFISHSSKNADVAQELCSVIEANGSQCFIAPRNIRSGYEYAAEILNGIDRSDAMLLVLSKEINDSPHVLREIERAVSKSIPIIVYKLEDVTLSKSLEYFLMTHQWLNAEKGNHEHLLRCIADLRDNTSTATALPISSASPQEKIKNKSKALPVAIAIAGTGFVALIASLFIILSGSDKDTTTTSNTTSNISENQVADNSTEEDSEEVSKDNSKNESTASEETTEESATEENTTGNGNSHPTEVKLGDTIVLGRYNDAEIRWRVIKISDDGTEAVLIANNILTFKSFSAAESGRCHYDGDTDYYGSAGEVLEGNYELQAYVKGNSNWSTSTIRTWLNSDKSNVNYIAAIPTASAMSDRKNGYNSEAGFLYYFTDEELSAIKETTVETKGNALSDSETITTTDYVFLLSIEELKWLENANVSFYTAPTEEAITQNESYWYRDVCEGYYKTDTCLWWLRDPVDSSSSECYAVSFGTRTEELYYPYLVSVEDFGIRPAITVDLTSNCIKVVK